MPVKPSNCVSVISDRLVTTPIVDLSAASADPIEFSDPDNDYEVVSVTAVVTTDYVAAQVTNMNLGISGDTTKFVSAASLGAVLVSAGASVPTIVPDDATVVKLSAGEAMTIGHVQNAGQTGIVRFVVRLRPYDKQNYASKRPHAAQSPT